MFRLEDVYLPIETSTLHGGPVLPLYNVLKGKRISGKIRKKRGNRKEG